MVFGFNLNKKSKTEEKAYKIRMNNEDLERKAFTEHGTPYNVLPEKTKEEVSMKVAKETED